MRAELLLLSDHLQSWLISNQSRGGWIRTIDLKVMSLASYRAALLPERSEGGQGFEPRNQPRQHGNTFAISVTNTPPRLSSPSSRKLLSKLQPRTEAVHNTEPVMGVEPIQPHTLVPHEVTVQPGTDQQGSVALASGFASR